MPSTAYSVIERHREFRLAHCPRLYAREASSVSFCKAPPVLHSWDLVTGSLGSIAAVRLLHSMLFGVVAFSTPISYCGCPPLAPLTGPRFGDSSLPARAAHHPAYAGTGGPNSHETRFKHWRRIAMNQLAQKTFASRGASLRKSPGFTLTVVVTLRASASAPMPRFFTLFDQVLLRMLPVQRPAEIGAFRNGTAHSPVP